MLVVVDAVDVDTEEAVFGISMNMMKLVQPGEAASLCRRTDQAALQLWSDTTDSH